MATSSSKQPRIAMQHVYPEDGRHRVVIEGVEPEVDCGAFPIKRTTGETVMVEGDIFADGHDAVSAVLLYRNEGETGWSEAPMRPLVNDRWRGEFRVGGVGCSYYSIQAWVDHFKTWRRDLAKKVEAGQDVAIDLLVGADLVAAAVTRASGSDARQLEAASHAMRPAKAGGLESQIQAALDERTAELMERYSDRRFATTYQELRVVVDRPKARFSTWYEMFPRSATPEPGRHGTLRDVIARLPYVAQMGFDVLYLPPIHPIGESFRKGRNNAIEAAPGEPGSPWGIGAAEGGHKAIHSELGTLEDFEELVSAAKEHGIEIALDIAFQTSPDHPYVTEHPEWFRQRPDGTIQYAENPPKKYQDIYPLNFETEQWRELWEELKSVMLFWIDRGVRIFRVDNPHTKPFRFWEWLIGEIKRDYPDVLFLSEAFTRPKVMYRLAKLGFSQSYTYFAWRNTKSELTEYFTELTQTKVREFFRPNVWPNTPDILTEYLQHGGRPAFAIRLILAGTLAASYGIYGPPFELYETRPRSAGSEEYMHSEKYEIRHWDLERPDSLRLLIARVNQIRREHPALQSNSRLHFHEVDNQEIICYSKSTEDLSDVILTIVNLDPNFTQSGWVSLSLDTLGIDPGQSYQVDDLLHESSYLWHGSRNYVELNPHTVPAHIFRVRTRVRTERDFEYFM